jgi:hypothetical protein
MALRQDYIHGVLDANITPDYALRGEIRLTRTKLTGHQRKEAIARWEAGEVLPILLDPIA